MYINYFYLQANLRAARGHLQVSSFIFHLTLVPMRELRCLLVFCFFVFFWGFSVVAVLFLLAQVGPANFCDDGAKSICAWRLLRQRRAGGGRKAEQRLVVPPVREDKSNIRNNFYP